MVLNSGDRIILRSGSSIDYIYTSDDGHLYNNATYLNATPFTIINVSGIHEINYGDIISLENNGKYITPDQSGKLYMGTLPYQYTIDGDNTTLNIGSLFTLSDESNKWTNMNDRIIMDHSGSLYSYDKYIPPESLEELWTQFVTFLKRFGIGILVGFIFFIFILVQLFK